MKESVPLAAALARPMRISRAPRFARSGCIRCSAFQSAAARKSGFLQFHTEPLSECRAGGRSAHAGCGARLCRSVRAADGQYSRLPGCGNRAGRHLLFEGAQGALLDVDHGTYPFVTSSHCVAGAAATGAGVGPRQLHYILGVAKAYCTRVGSGPFPSELYDANNPARCAQAGAALARTGHEFGSVTRRPRRTGWLDTAALARSLQLNSASGLCITKLDVLDAFDSIRLCTGYRLNGRRVDALPSSASLAAQCEPVYEDHPGWKTSTAGIRAWDDLPANARAYLRRIEAAAGVPIDLISTGPQRDAMILVRHPFD